MAVSGPKAFTTIALVTFFLTWVACCVHFGSPLQLCVGNAGFGYVFYWNGADNKVLGNEAFYSYDTLFDMSNGQDIWKQCLNGGRGLLAFSVLSFFVLIVLMGLSIMRLIGKEHKVPKIGASLLTYLTVELVLSFIVSFFFFLNVIIWGGSCFSSARSYCTDNGNYPFAGTGYGYTIFAFLAVLIGTILIFVVRRKAGSAEYSQADGGEPAGNATGFPSATAQRSDAPQDFPSATASGSDKPSDSYGTF